MKWETYNKMTDEQKEEYNYKFVDYNPPAPLQSFTTTSLLLWLIMSIFIMAVYISVTSDDPKMIELRPTLFQSLNTFSKSIGLYLGIITGYSIIWLITRLHLNYKERKWLRENGIETKS